MKARGILFSAPMVRALLSGNKTQTRRVCKEAPYSGGKGHPEQSACESGETASPYGAVGDHLWVRESFYAYGHWETRFNDRTQREEWRFTDRTIACGCAYQYDADTPALSPASTRGGALPQWYKRPAIFMPRAASRIVLEIVSVRVERLNDCSEADAIAEGLQASNGGAAWHVEEGKHCAALPVACYASLWEAIHGAGSWAANPWVWVLAFRRVMP